MEKMRKDLVLAHELAAKNHPLSHYKDLLHQFQEDLMEQEEKAKEAKAAKATPKGKKGKAAADADEDGDVEMEDAADEDGTPPKEKKAKKRKAEDTAEVRSEIPLPDRDLANICARLLRGPTR